MKRRCIFFMSVILMTSFLFADSDSALEFDGINDYVQLSNLFDIGSSSFTVEMWVKIPPIGQGNLTTSERVGILFGNYGQGNGNINFEVYSSGQTRYYWGNSEINKFGSKDLRDGAWHHLAFVRDKVNNKIFVYVDGIIDIESAGVGTDFNVTALHRIGNDNRSSGNPYFHGQIDEVRIWNIARSESQLREYMCEDVTAQSGLLSYYKMSEASGTTLPDNTGDGNTGTLFNMDDSDWVRDNQTPAGDGSTISFKINGLNQLYWLSQASEYWTSDFEQITDISAVATESWDAGAGFTPIGIYNLKFSGNYMGNNHTIRDLTINRVLESGVALFGRGSLGATISNLHLVNVNILGESYIGALVGMADKINISQCSSTGTVSGTRYIGGLVGYIEKGIISESFSSVNVDGSSNGIGGLVGFADDVIRDCYASGSVVGDQDVGGLIGDATSFSNTANCYSRGSVSGNLNVGGLIGYAGEGSVELGVSPAEVTGCFWDSEASGNATSDEGIAKTTAEMKSMSTYTNAGWDFINETANGSNNYWGLNDSEHEGYPFLSWENYTHNASEVPLPVCLNSFEATSKSGVVELTWTTESETENLGYILERKVNNDWEMIASYLNNPALIGNGTSTSSHNYFYTDNNVIAGQTYAYRLSDVSESNQITELKIIEISTDASHALSPKEFALTAAYPNPFNPSLSIQYALDQGALTEVSILDLKGKIVAKLENSFKEAGSYELIWNAENCASGIYIIKITAAGKSDLRKVSLMK